MSATAGELQLRRARELVKQVAAIETGAIEGLYEEDRGFTITAATEVAAFAAALETRPQKARAYIEAQLRAYDFVLDVATQAHPITEVWIRELHHVICGEGATYHVETAVGPQEQELPLGVYKRQPNHVKLPSGNIHSYAPVDQTPVEMQRLVAELQSSAFVEAHPVLQSAYSHYGIVWIHPFADGNGRVARALASVFSYRSASIPILITAQQKPEYLEALRRADRGDRQSFVRFIFERGVDTMGLIAETLRTAAVADLAEVLTQLHGIYTPGRYDPIFVDEAAHRVFDAFGSIARNLVANLPKLITASWSFDSSVGPGPEGFRTPVEGGARRAVVTFTSAAPADASLARAYIVYVPANADENGVIRLATGTDHVDISLRDVLGATVMPIGVEARLNMFARRTLADHLRELHAQGAPHLKERGC